MVQYDKINPEGRLRSSINVLIEKHNRRKRSRIKYKIFNPGTFRADYVSGLTSARAPDPLRSASPPTKVRPRIL